MKNEKRLIDADDCGRYIASCMGFSQASLENVMQYMEDYTKQNEVDAVEVVHGRWIKADRPIVLTMECSVCHMSFLLGNYNYCPNCGAKMDGERKDNADL